MNILSVMFIIFLGVNAIHLATVLIFALFCPQTFEVAAKRACFDWLGQARGAETMSGAAERLGIHP